MSIERLPLSVLYGMGESLSKMFKSWETILLPAFTSVNEIHELGLGLIRKLGE